MLTDDYPIKEEFNNPTRKKYAGKFLKKRALVDPQLFKNGVRDQSYAERKTMFIGEEGAFDSSHL